MWDEEVELEDVAEEVLDDDEIAEEPEEVEEDSWRMPDEPVYEQEVEVSEVVRSGPVYTRGPNGALIES